MRAQFKLDFEHRDDPSKCASAFCRLQHPTRKPTHVVTTGKFSFNVCSSDARKWESVRGAKVQKIQKGAA